MVLLRDGRAAARQHARNHHQARRADLLRMGRMGRGKGRVHRPRAHDHRQPGLHEPFHPFHPLRIRQQRPVAHRAAVDDRRHAGLDQFLRLAHQRVEVGLPVGGAGGHQRGDHAGENVGLHAGSSGASECAPESVVRSILAELYFPCRQKSYSGRSSRRSRAKKDWIWRMIWSAWARPSRSHSSTSPASMAAMMSSCSPTMLCGRRSL